MVDRVCCFFLAISLLLAAPARAQPAPAASPDKAKAEARSHLVEGVRLHKRGEYDSALREFKRAYEIFPSPKLHFNMGQAYLSLGHDVQALEEFRRYLADAGDADPDARRDAAQYADDLSRRVARVQVVCETAGAEVSIDGRSYGLTPLADALPVMPGTHQVVVTRTGGAPYLERVEVQAGATWIVTASFAPGAGGPTTVAQPHAPAAPAPALVAQPAPRAAAPADDGAGRSRWWLWAGLGLVVAGGAVTAVLLARDRSPAPFCDCDVSPGIVSVPVR